MNCGCEPGSFERENEERSLIKVTFTYDNGEVEYLDGKNLKKWDAACESTVALSFARTGATGFEGIKFKKE